MRHWLLSLTLLFLPAATWAQSLAVGQAEASRCMDQIAAVRREVLNKYSDTLAELKLQLQKAADLEGAVAVRNELERVQKEQSLVEKDLVSEPRALRSAQQQSLTKMEELTAALVNEAVPKLIEVKKRLTVDGKLDDALAVRALIEKLQGDYMKMERPAATSLVTADTLVQAYSADRTRADKTYKGARMTVRGVIGAIRPDPADPKAYVIYLKGSSNSGWVACFLTGGNLKFREEKQPNGTQLVILQRDGDPVTKVQLNMTVDIQGECQGFEDVVRLTKCEAPVKSAG